MKVFRLAFLFGVAFVFIAGASFDVFAQENVDKADAKNFGSAPAMLNVKEIILQPLRTGDAEIANSCGVSRKDVGATIIENLSKEKVPVIPISEARPPIVGVARIDLIPEVVTLNTQGGDCTSWLSMVAQTQNTLVIPPVEVPRNVIITYWRSGMIVSSTQTGHGEALNKAVQKLTKLFSKQYKIDQPPDLLKSDKDKNEKNN